MSKKKILKKLREFKQYYSHLRFYKEQQPVIYIDIDNRTKVRTYLNLFFRIHAAYEEPIVIKFSVLRMLVIAKWFKELDYIYFESPLSKLNKHKTFSHQATADFRVNFNYRKITTTDTYIKNSLPYIMHPINYLQVEPQRLDKNIGIMFSGNIDEKIYNTRLIPDQFGLLNRWEIYNEIKGHHKSEVISGELLIRELETARYKDRLVIMRWQTGAIPSEKWRTYLSAAHFLLCAPGMTMPLCHNVVEAMSMGVIPILNYPHWLNPSLREDVNCLVYQSLSDLDVVINKALALSDEKKLEMSRSVTEYYKTYYENYAFSEDGLRDLIVLNENSNDLEKEN